MKKMLPILLLGASAFATAAYANHHGDKDGNHAERQAKKEAKAAEHFAEVDTDGSGNISRAEFIAYKTAKAENEWDSNTEFAGDDGELSLEEMKAFHKAKRQERRKKYKGHKKGHKKDSAE